MDYNISSMKFTGNVMLFSECAEEMKVKDWRA